MYVCVCMYDGCVRAHGDPELNDATSSPSTTHVDPERNDAPSRSATSHIDPECNDILGAHRSGVIGTHISPRARRDGDPTYQ